MIFANGCNRPVKLRYIRAGLETSRGENPQLISAPSPRYLLSPSTVAGRSSFRSRHVNSPAFLIDNRVSQRPFPLTIWWTNGIGNEAASRLRRPSPLFPPRSLSPWTDLSFLVSPSSSFSSCHAEVFYRLRSIGFLASGGDIYIYIKFLIKPQFSSSPLFSNETRFLPLLFFFFSSENLSQRMDREWETKVERQLEKYWVWCVSYWFWEILIAAFEAVFGLPIIKRSRK